MTGATTAPQFLAHQPTDHVAVAVRDISPGPANGYALDGDTDLSIEVTEAVPLGHKVALVDLDEGADVIEYGVRIGVTTAAVSAGQYVHTHNLRSARWQSSIAD